MAKFDIRIYKDCLRDKSKQYRISLSPKDKLKKDNLIIKSLLSMVAYKKCRLILTYVSTKIEVDTINLIETAWKDKKEVAVPRCIPGTRKMEFYKIKSLDDLTPGTFGVLEPIPEKCQLIRHFPHSICIVPGLCFDNFGYRLGYGKGYYDRFLSGYKGTKIGICYKQCIKYSLKYGKFDVPSDIVINENYIKYVNKTFQKYFKNYHHEQGGINY